MHIMRVMCPVCKGYDAPSQNDAHQTSLNRLEPLRSSCLFKRNRCKAICISSVCKVMGEIRSVMGQIQFVMGQFQSVKVGFQYAVGEILIRFDAFFLLFTLLSRSVVKAYLNLLQI